MNYTDFQDAIYQITALTDDNSAAMLAALMPRVIEAAENRIYREPQFDFLATRTSDITQHATPGIRSVPIPPQFLVIEGAALILPADAASPSDAGAKRVPMLRATRSQIDFIWPTESLTQTPTDLSDIYYAVFNEEDPAPADTSEPGSVASSIKIAPTPDAAYRIEFTGTQQPDPLSAENPATFITTYLPDLMIVSAMIFVAGGALHNYGAQGDDPRMSVSWLSVYKDLLAGVAITELRKKALVDGRSTRYAGTNLQPNIAALQQQAAAQPAAA